MGQNLLCLGEDTIQDKKATKIHSSSMSTARLLTVSRSIGGGVSTSGARGCLPLVPGGVCLWSRGHDVCLWSGGVSASGPEGVYPLGRHRPAQCWDTPRPAQCMLGYTPLDRQTPVKTLPSQTSFASGKITSYQIPYKHQTVYCS